jgi:hypothetical protein
MTAAQISRNFIGEAVKLLLLLIVVGVYSLPSYGQAVTGDAARDHADNSEDSKPFAVVTMVPPDVFFRIDLDEESLSRVGCKYFFSDASIVEGLLSTIERRILSGEIVKLIRLEHGGYNLDVRYKLEFGGRFTGRGDYPLGPSGQEFLAGVLSNGSGYSERRSVTISRDVLPPFFALMQMADNFGKPAQRCDVSVLAYSNPQKWRR